MVMIEPNLAIALIGLALIFAPFFAYKIFTKSSQEKAAFYVFWVGTSNIVLIYLLKVTGLISILSKVNLILLLTALFIPHFLSAIYIPSLKTEKALILAITSTLSIIIAMFLIAGSINISSVMG